MVNKKHILILVDKYYPESSANTQCADIIATYLEKKGFNVDFLSLKNDGGINRFFVDKKRNIIKIENYIAKTLRRVGKVFNAKKWTDFPVWFRKPISFYNKYKNPFMMKTENVVLDCINYNKVIEDVASVAKNYHSIISFSSPFALQVIAKKLKQNNLTKNWVAILLDPFVYNATLNKRRINKRKAVAEKVLNGADKIFMVRGIMEENINKNYNPNYHSKVDVIELPNLVEPVKKAKKVFSKNKEIILTYAGSFYKDIRNPSVMLDILSKLPNNFKIKIIGYCCEDIIEEKSKLFNGNFDFLGKMVYTKTIEHLNNSNVLINLGNTITNQTPSKVFEYIALGKPILNFYFSEEDTSLFYFKKYPLAFNVNLNNYDEHTIEDIIKFCDSNKNNCLDFICATNQLSECRSDVICEKIHKSVNKI